MSAGYPSTLETHTLETASLPLPTQGNCQWLVLQTAKCKGLRHWMAVAGTAGHFLLGGLVV